MTGPARWEDSYYDKGGRSILTYDQMGIPGLNMLGRHFLGRAVLPLESHYHQDAIEITYVAKGNASFQVEGREYRLSGGDVFITQANEAHGTGVMLISVCEIYWFQLDISAVENFLFVNNQWAKGIISALGEIKNRVIKMGGDYTKETIKDLFYTMYNEGQEGKYKGASLLLLFLQLMIEQDKEIQFSLTPDIARATEYILEHLCDKITLEELAARSTLSLSRFKEKFKAQIGVTPREFINYHKVQKAKELLQAGYTVTDTAMELDFSSSNYFSVVFRRFTATSPTGYVKQLEAKPPA